jgi:hypothetical protein
MYASRYGVQVAMILFEIYDWDYHAAISLALEWFNSPAAMSLSL